MTPARPTFETLLHLTRHSMINAEELLADAETLLAARRWPRAYALAVLALEEFGKAGVCQVWLAHPDLPEKEFWSDFSSHVAKLQGALAWIAIFAPETPPSLTRNFERVRQQAGADHAHKMRGLYVDLAPDGQTIHSSSQITEADAQQLVTSARVVLGPIMRSWADPAAVERIKDIVDHRAEFESVLELGVQAVRAEPDRTVQAVAHHLQRQLAALNEAKSPADQPEAV
jgi:AbiV family abortive infection protein